MDIKKIKVIPISHKDANTFVKKWHYSKKTCSTSQIHFGCLYEGVLVGCLQYGGSIDARRTSVGLKCGMREFIELNRMAMIDNTPKNAESRVISITLRLLKKAYPFLRLVLSFSDACQCGDGTIYRASGFDLIDIKKNRSMILLNEESKKLVAKYIGSAREVICDKTLNSVVVSRKAMDSKCVYKKDLTRTVLKLGSRPLEGYQFKYVYFFDKALRKEHKIIPFNEIPEQCRMYLGNRRAEHESNAGDFQLPESGVTPTSTHQ